MKPVIRINRDTLITGLLVVAGIMLALALFAAGVFWRSKSVPTKSHFGMPTQIESGGWAAFTRKSKNVIS